MPIIAVIIIIIIVLLIIAIVIFTDYCCPLLLRFIINNRFRNIKGPTLVGYQKMTIFLAIRWHKEIDDDDSCKFLFSLFL